MVTNTAKMDTLIITMGTGAILRKVILITIMGKAEITTMVTGRYADLRQDPHWQDHHP